MSLNKFVTLLIVGGTTTALIGCCANHKRGVDNVDISNQDAIISTQESTLTSKKTFYFSLDSYELNQEAKEVIAAHAKELLNNPSLHLRVIGHADERGSKKYNITLGKLRAEAVAKVLERNGVATDRISILSYGKERPIAIGHNEQAWSQNRRVELIYEGDKL